MESVDARGYELLARNLGSGHGFSLQDSAPYLPDGLRTPIYPAFVASIYAVTGERPVAVAIGQALLESMTVLIVSALGAALIGKRAGITAAIIYALTPVQWRYTSALLPEILLAFLISLSVWLLTRSLSSSHPFPTRQNAPTLGPAASELLPGRYDARRSAVMRFAIVCGAVAGLVALTKPNVAVLTLILAIGAVLKLRENGGKAGAVAGVIILASAIVVSPWVIRNWAVFGRPFLSQAGLGYIARVAAPATLGVVENHQVPPWSHEWEARYHALVTQVATRYGSHSAFATALSPREADRRERQIAQAAWDILLEHPWEALRAQFIGFGRSWAPLEQTFWYSHLSGHRWEETGVDANSYRDAVEILFSGRPIEAFESAMIDPWRRLEPLGAALWYGWGLGHLIGISLMTLGVWQLRQRPVFALIMVSSVLYATLPPGPIGYVRFRVPVMPLITVLEVAGLVFLISKLGALYSLRRASYAKSVQRSEYG